MIFNSFDNMVKTACRIEDVLKEQGILTRHGNNNNNGQNNNNSNKDKGKNVHWNKNKQVVNDGVLDSPQPKDQGVLHWSSTIQAMKLNAPPQQESRPRYQEKPKKEKFQFSKLGDSYGDVFKILISNNLVHPQDPTKHYITHIKPHWWDEKDFYKFHNGIGHTIENCWKLKHIIQDLIENGNLKVDGLNTNVDHKAFKEPLPKYEKGETSKPKDGKAAINYTYTATENVINMLEVVEESVNMTWNKDPYGYDSYANSPPIFDEEPVVVLRGPHSRMSSQALNVVTRIQGPIVIRGTSSGQPNKPKQVVSKNVTTKLAINPKPNYNLFGQL